MTIERTWGSVASSSWRRRARSGLKVTTTQTTMAFEGSNASGARPEADDGIVYARP
jgi:hypothetical protein